jgi:5'(3')-deoxyribonucleotidase
VKRLFVDMDNVLVDFPAGIASLAPELRREYEGRLDEVPGIFARMPPLAGALESYEELARRFDTYVLSTAPWENPSAWSDKLLWIRRHLGKSAYKRLVLSHHKDLVVGDFLVDDRLKNGVERFRGEHVHFGTERFPDWAAVRAYLLARA